MTTEMRHKTLWEVLDENPDTLWAIGALAPCYTSKMIKRRWPEICQRRAVLVDGKAQIDSLSSYPLFLRKIGEIKR